MKMITIPQNVMRLSLIAAFAAGGIVAERLAIAAYKLARPTVKRLYGKLTGAVVPHVPLRVVHPKNGNGKRNGHKADAPATIGAAG